MGTFQRKQGRVSQHRLPGGNLRTGSGPASQLEALVPRSAQPLRAGPAPSTAPRSLLIRFIFSPPLGCAVDPRAVRGCQYPAAGRPVPARRDGRSLGGGLCFIHCWVTRTWSRAQTGRCPVKSKSRVKGWQGWAFPSVPATVCHLSIHYLSSSASFIYISRNLFFLKRLKVSCRCDDLLPLNSSVSVSYMQGHSLTYPQYNDSCEEIAGSRVGGPGMWRWVLCLSSISVLRAREGRRRPDCRAGSPSNGTGLELS